MNTPLIEVKNICKSFNTRVVNKNISFKLYSGKTYALLGENGAGKSTLMKMLAGFLKPDKGTITFLGKETKIKNPNIAKKLGIAMVYQHFQLVDNFTVLQNIMLGKEQPLFTNKNNLKKKINKICSSIGISINLDKKIEDMTVSEKQWVEILKTLYEKPKFIILDEPTATLTPQEATNFFNVLHNLKKLGHTILLVTHKLDEILNNSDEVLILRKGKIQKQVQTNNVNSNVLASLMVGKQVKHTITYIPSQYQETLLTINNLTIKKDKTTNIIDDFSFSIKKGEILGVAGLTNSGQKELCESIAGITTVHKGQIKLGDINIENKPPRKIATLGVGVSFVPEDRLGMGLIPNYNMVDNLMLKTFNTQKSLFLDRKDTIEHAKNLIKKLNIKPKNYDLPLVHFSGGNIQKILLGRELELQPKILLVAYPTRGLDIASSHLIYELLNEQKQKGIGILYIAEDLDVLLDISDRVMVMCQGKNIGIIDRQKQKNKEFDKEEIGLMMTGLKKGVN